LGALIGVDQIIKFWLFQAGQGVINPGGFLGIGEQWWWEWGLLPLFLYLGYLYFRASNTLRILLVLLLAGGLSNWGDRFMFGGVRDVFYYPWLKMYGNMADIYLTVAALGYALIMWQSRKKTHEDII
jgi:lipoprotein signal peptidase